MAKWRKLDAHNIEILRSDLHRRKYKETAM